MDFDLVPDIPIYVKTECKGQSSPAKIFLASDDKKFAVCVSTCCRQPDEDHHEVYKDDGPKMVSISPAKGECFTTEYIYFALIASGPCRVKSSIYFPMAMRYRTTKEFKNDKDPKTGSEFIFRMLSDAR